MANMPYVFDDSGRAVCSLCDEAFPREHISVHYKKCLDGQHIKRKAGEKPKRPKKVTKVAPKMLSAKKLKKLREEEKMESSRILAQDQNRRGLEMARKNSRAKRLGFHESAKVSHSNLRKITKS